jgi:hypothetical protein
MKILALLLLLAAPALGSSSDTVKTARSDLGFGAEAKGLVAQNDSLGNRSLKDTGTIPVENDANGLAKILGAVAVGLVIFIAAMVLLRCREGLVPPGEDEPPRKKEPPKRDG